MENVSKRKTRKRRQSNREENKDVDTDVDGVNCRERITYDVLRLMLEYFNITDLTRAAMVCRSWNEAAEKEIHTRLKPQHFLLEPNTESKKITDPKYVVDKLFIQPSVGMVFNGFHTRRQIWQPDCLCNYLPPQTDYITLTNSGTIYDEVENKARGLSSIFFPEIPDVKIKYFHTTKLDYLKFDSTQNPKSSNKLARELCKISPKEENIKCIIMFLGGMTRNIFATPDPDHVESVINSIVSYGTNTAKNKIAIWGGIARRVMVCSSSRDKRICKKSVPIAGLSICGSGVSTWSMVLNSRIKTKEQAEKELTALRDAVKLQKHTIGFMFSCCARGDSWYSEPNVEAKIFRKLFPNVPLIGSIGDGEFGVSTVRHEYSPDERIFHQYATIFLIVSYGSVRKVL
ncbi:F-box only protein 22-like [Neodiprion virginianus]|uniref:F-box only protein 22-like n=1 Tax=Neodiprion fabricii TaxID=2872261 RepID=UPI001ED984FE|nr:F-box only protein 22-like [Neodiprion fabricii]XP_046610257.1 F-box only protein 22-like [Neodiprion virginianus]